ncbi:Histidinol-phosphate aminotransferase [Chromobacterium violaceum]|uniref:Putative 8-amino-7-oxononanoate synthase n=1 Tax=Chromobacterium violaceum TaxID=536 RepID=A0A3S4LDC5_CHRVL|nr:Histidinol-phosphate aminotransferase [Chromobacterium violaceum]
MPHYARHLEHHTIVNPFPGIAKLEAALGRKVASRLGANESMVKPASPLLEQWGEALAELARLYPDPYALALRERVAQRLGLESSQVLFDCGADSLILLALRLRCNAGDAVVCSAGTYPAFRYFAEGVGARILEVPYQSQGVGLRPDLARLCEVAQAERAVVVYLANPDNPTGHYWSAADIQALRQQLPSQTLLILDEAYIDFCTQPEDAPPPARCPTRCGCARCPRPTRWPACAWVSRWRRPRSSPRPTRSGRSTRCPASPSTRRRRCWTRRTTPASWCRPRCCCATSWPTRCAGAI